MRYDRRSFLGGALAFGSVGYGALPARIGNEADSLKLRFGVLSDIHVNEIGPDGKTWGNALFKKALSWYDKQGVDAVVVAGDLTDQGLGCNLEAVAEAWYSVFPNDHAKDGRKVEKIFVTGNHDFDGAWYTDYARQRYPDQDERKKQILCYDFEGWWERVFHETYSPFFVKTVKGFTFCGQHWDDGSRKHIRGTTIPFGEPLGRFLNSDGGMSLDPDKPFFYVQHPHLYGTCFGPWAWGHDRGCATKILSRHPNAIAFSGHSHYPMSDERSIWQGSFTSVGVGSLRYGSVPSEEFAPVGFENGSAGRYNQLVDSEKLLATSRTSARWGMLWSVYDGCMTALRYDFARCKSVGPLWKLPLTVTQTSPYAFAEHAQRVGIPEFQCGAKLKVEKVRAKTRGVRKLKVETREVEAIRVDIPAAVTKTGVKAWRYRVEIQNLSDPQTKNVLASGYDGVSNDVVSTECFFDLNCVPRGKVLVSVVPYNCFGDSGTPLLSEVEV